MFQLMTSVSNHRIAFCFVALSLLFSVAKSDRAMAAFQFTSLYDFTNEVIGSSPQASLTLGPGGYFYGTTEAGGAYDNGTVFELTPSGDLISLYSFTGGGDGEQPRELTLGTDGNFYGITHGGGVDNYGTVFKISPSGTLTSLYSFMGTGDGAYPLGKLALGLNGDLYGTASGDLALHDFGTIFRISPLGSVTTLYRFTGTSDGWGPEAGLTLGVNGNFYGTTTEGGGNGGGVVFEVSPSGTLMPLCSFSGGNGIPNPVSALAFGPDGNLYGTTNVGGQFGDGTVYRVTLPRTLTLLCSFTGGSDGAYPNSAVTLGCDGNLYGTTLRSTSAAAPFGTLFKISPNGILTTLYRFTGESDGAFPGGDLTLGPLNALYGTTGGQRSNFGSIFKFTYSSAPNIGSLSSTSVPAGHASFALGVYGTGFVKGSVVEWNSTPLTTTYFSETKVDASVPTSDLTTGGMVQVTLVNPGSTLSNALTFTIVPAPVLTSLSTSKVVAGHASFSLGVYGTGFATDSVVKWNGIALSTTYFSATKVDAVVPASDLAMASAAQVTLVDPGSPESNELTLTIEGS